MLRDPQSSRSRYGYIQTKDVPLMERASQSGEDGDSLLKTVSKLVLSAAGMYVGGRILRGSADNLMSGTRDILEEYARNEGTGRQTAKWLKDRLDDVKNMDDFFAKSEGVFEYTDEAGDKKNHSWHDAVDHDNRKGKEYLKKVLVSKAAAAARALPYEIPAAYVTNRLLIEREQLKEDIRKGKLNPKNPVDWAGDFSLQAVKYVAGDLSMRAAGPVAYQVHRKLQTHTAYDVGTYAIKRINAENMKWLSIQGERAQVVTDAAKMSLKKADLEIAGREKAPISGQNISGENAWRRLNPFDSSKWERYYLATKKLRDGELKKAMDGYNAAGTRRPDTRVEAQIATDIKEFNRQYHIEREADSGKVAGFGAVGEDLVAAQYKENLVGRLVEKHGLSVEAATEIVQTNSSRMNDKAISREVMRRARLGDHKGAEAVPTGRVDAGNIFRQHLIDDEPWEMGNRAVLEKKGIAYSGFKRAKGDALKTEQDLFMDAIEDSMPTVEQAMKWRSTATKQVIKSRKRAIGEFSKMKSAKLIIKDAEHYAGNAGARENASQRVLENIGFGQTGRDSGKSFEALQAALGTSSQDETIKYMRIIAKNRKIGTTRAMDRFNIFGLRRATTAEALEMDATSPADRVRGNLGRHAYTTRQATDASKKSFNKGINEVSDEIGRDRLGDLHADPGLFVNIAGDVVDFRSQIRALKRTGKVVTKSFQVPIVGFKPLQLIPGIENLFSEGSRFQHMQGGRNVFAYAEDDTLNRFTPSVKIGDDVWMWDKNREFKNTGAWNWIANDPRDIAVKNARDLSGYSRQAVRTGRQRRLFASGRFLEAPDPDNPLDGGTAWGHALDKKLPQIGRILKSANFSDDTETSLSHRIYQRITRSVAPEEGVRAWIASTKWFSKARAGSKTFNNLADGLGFNPNGALAPRKNFIANRWDDEYVDPVLEKLREESGDSTATLEEIATGQSKKAKASRRSSLRMEQVERARRKIQDDIEIDDGGKTAAARRESVKSDTIHLLENQSTEESNTAVSGLLAQMFRNNKGLGASFSGLEANDESSLRRAVAQITSFITNTENLTQEQIKHLRLTSDSLTKTMGRDMTDVNVRNSAHAKINSFYMQLAGMAQGEAGELELYKVEQQIRKMAVDGTITDRSIADQALAAVAAARLRLTDTKGNVASLDYLETIAVAVPNAIKRIIGPAAAKKYGVRGTYSARDFYNEEDNPILGLANVYRYTLGNQNWLHPEELIDESLPHVFNPFEGSRYVGVRSSMHESGVVDSLKSMGRMLVGQSEGEVGQTRVGEVLQGAVFGNQKVGNFRKGVTTDATIGAWHLVRRVSDVLNDIGIGIDPSKFNSPVDYMVNGLLARRALPLYAGIVGAGYVAGMPGIGKDGVMGAAAWTVGPGLGQARAAAFEATGANEFFKTAADVMSLDEDAQFRDLSRTKEEERQYWESGVRPIRAGRYWLLGSKPFKGGKVDYYKPNWYRMFKSDYQYTDEFKGSRLEWAMFGNDLSPLRMVDPYHYERKWEKTRPYPVSGDLFTGPWGPLTPVLNATIGNVIKPKRRMHTDLAAEQEEAYLTGVINASAVPMADRDAVVLAYKTGKLKIGDLMVANGNAALGTKTSIANINEVSRRSSGQGIKSAEDANSPARQAANRMVFTGTSTGATRERSKRFTTALNKFLTAKSGERYVDLGEGSYLNPELIPAMDMPVISPRRYDFNSKYTVNAEEATKPGGLAYRAGEFGYLAQEWGGIYGFGIGSMRESFGLGGKDYTPSGPVMESADRAYGAERAFWDRDLGGLGDIMAPWKVNVQLSEITRRFLPHKRNDIDRYNPIPNQMPAWMPTDETYFLDFSVGDPFTKVKLGEARMPGLGYEKLNNLHPDMYGEYGAFDRFKILADVAPWSREYMYYRDILTKSELPTDLKNQVSDIKNQVAERKKKVVLHPRKWDGRLEKAVDGELMPVKGDPNLWTIEGQEGPFRLAGVRFAKSEVGQAESKAFYEKFLKGRNVGVYADAERPDRETNVEKTLDVIVKNGNVNYNEMLADRQRGGADGITLAQSTSYVDSVVKYGPGWRTVGKLWESVAHVDIPFKNKALKKDTADEYYNRKMVYGRIWQPWETPISSFLQPFAEQTTRPGRGIMGWAIGAFALGLVSGGFWDANAAPKAAKYARIAGTIVGGTMAVWRSATSAITGQEWVPKRRRKEWAVDEYADILSYVKYSKLYESARQQAIAEEGVDPEAYAQMKEAGGDDQKQQYQDKWKKMPIGQKPDKPMSEKALESMGATGALALQFRKMRDSTMYGLDVNGDVTNMMYSIPKRYRDLFTDMMQTPVSKRKSLLDHMPRLMRRVFEAKWGMDIEKKPSLTEYFKQHELPAPDWEGWLPEVNLDEVKIKIIRHEGLDHSEFGYYPQQVDNALQAPWAYPEFRNGTGISKDQLANVLTEMGVRDVQVEYLQGKGLAGFDFDLTHDRRQDIRGMVNAG